MEFNDMTQAMLEEYEKQYFDVVRVPSLRGANRQPDGAVKAAIAAGWIGEPFDGYTDGAWRNEVVDADKVRAIRKAAEAVDERYRELLFIDPNG